CPCAAPGAPVRAHHAYRALVPRARFQRDRPRGLAATEAGAVQLPASLQGLREIPMILWPKRAASDEAANAQDEYCRQVAEGVHGVEALFDEQLRLLWISPSIERVTGYVPADCLAAPDLFALIVHESDRTHC